MAGRAFELRDVAPGEREDVVALLARRWGSSLVVSRGVVHRFDELPAILAVDRDEVVGVVTYVASGSAWEVTSLDSLRPGIGIGTALLQAVATRARGSGADRLWLITTNDNTPALRFYQRRGWHLVALRAGEIARSRALKPEIPETGIDGIAIRDELELELPLDSAELVLDPPGREGRVSCGATWSGSSWGIVWISTASSWSGSTRSRVRASTPRSRPTRSPASSGSTRSRRGSCSRAS